MKSKDRTLFARLMLPFGIVMLLSSFWSLSLQDPQSAERIITWVNIALGAVLVIVGVHLFPRGKEHADS